jgi:tRNA-dihydrouridine synthase B
MSQKNGPVFRIGGIPIKGDVILAPMDGITDPPFRSIACKYGSAMSYTEFINAKEVLANIRLVLPKLMHGVDEHPLAFQVYDEDPYRILDACLLLLPYKPDLIDVNIGCSVKAVSGRGAGAGLLREPEKVRRIITLLSRNIPIPITAKIRLGWDDAQLNYLQIAHIIEESGGKAIAVHARTRQQSYKQPARWETIREIKRATRLPVIGNGDIRSPKDIDRMLLETGCDAVMIGRAAIGNPWILNRLDKSTIGNAEVFLTTIQHLKKSIEFYGETKGVWRFRKFLKAYLDGRDLGLYKIQNLLAENDRTILVSVLENLYENSHSHHSGIVKKIQVPG